MVGSLQRRAAHGGQQRVGLGAIRAGQAVQILQGQERLDDIAAGRVSPYEVAADVVEGLKQGERV